MHGTRSRGTSFPSSTIESQSSSCSFFRGCSELQLKKHSGALHAAVESCQLSFKSCAPPLSLAQLMHKLARMHG